MTRKVSFAIDMAADKAAAERRVEGKGKVERASETMDKVERTGMWASIKHYSDPTAHQSLHLLACRADAQILNQHAGVQTWTVALYGKLPTATQVVEFIADSGVRPVKKWLYEFSEFTHLVAAKHELTSHLATAGRAERDEQDWKDAVKRAHATHALHEHMVCCPVQIVSQD